MTHDHYQFDCSKVEAGDYIVYANIDSWILGNVVATVFQVDKGDLSGSSLHTKIPSTGRGNAVVDKSSIFGAFRDLSSALDYAGKMESDFKIAINAPSLRSDSHFTITYRRKKFVLLFIDSLKVLATA